MPDAPTPLDLDAIRRAEAWRILDALGADLGLLVDVAASGIPADVLRPILRNFTRGTPAPAWDEEVVAAEVARALREHGGWFADLPADEMDCCARAVLAVVRDHLPVKPGREEVAAAVCGLTRAEWDRLPEATREELREAGSRPANGVLNLWPGRSEAEVRADARIAAYREWFVKHAEVSSGYYLIPCVDCAGTGVFPVPAGYEGDSSCVRCKATGAVPLSAVDPKIDDTWAEIKARWQAEALREAADAVTEIDGRADDAAARWLRDRADRTAAEGGADRG